MTDYKPFNLVDQIRALRTFKSGTRRAPHKPLLILYAIGQLQAGNKTVTFPEVKTALLPLLDAYAPPVRGRHQPELPYWHLSTDGLWDVHDRDELDRQASGFPRMSALQNSTAGFTDEVAEQLSTDSELTATIVAQLLDEHFAPSTHEAILNAAGIHLEDSTSVEESKEQYTTRKKRDPRFREQVLRAYEYRCAFSGFRAAIGGSYFGCEAAHVQWHAYKGPDLLSNGLSLEPTVHKLFDVGAWSLTDQRTIIVSQHLTGTDATIKRIRSKHGQQLIDPLPGTPELDIKFIRWHREPDQGGVFRGPALP